MKRVQGSFFAYERFDKYKPREDGEASFTAGPKKVHFDRVEWHVQPDYSTKAAAMQAGEMNGGRTLPPTCCRFSSRPKSPSWSPT